MALTVTTTFDVSGGTQTITFNNPSEVDKITYSGGTFTFSTELTFNLSKSDLQLYIQYLIAYYNLINFNFPTLNFTAAWPLSQFDISTTNVGVKKIIYTQTSQGNGVYLITYVPIAVSSSFAARSSVTLTIQEFYMMVLMLQQYSSQVTFN